MVLLFPKGDVDLGVVEDAGDGEEGVEDPGAGSSVAFTIFFSKDLTFG